MSIHSSAIIDPSAIIGKDVTVEAYAVIGPGVKIGDRSVIRSHAILEYTELGIECVVYPFASIGLTPQHLGYKGENTKLIVGDRTTFRESVTAHRGTMFDKGVTKIGNDCFFMAYSHIAHDCIVGNNVIMANAAQLAGHVQVGDRSFISTTVGIHQFVRIGGGAMISGGSMVPMDVAPFSIAQGDRAELRGLNLVGMKRAGIPRESIKRIKEAYKKVFLSGLSLADALKDSALNLDDSYVTLFRQFFEAPKRGFVRPTLSISGLGESEDSAE